jgi:uncharacterized protein YggE
MKIVRIALLAALGLAAAAFVGVGLPDRAHGTAAPSGRTITVAADGTVTRVPDQADVSFSVVARGATAAEALAADSADMQKVLAALDTHGVAKRDVQTQDVSLDPQFDKEGRTIVGYVARNSVSVSTAIAKAGDVIDAAVGAGANEVSGPSPSLSGREQLYRDALQDAVRKAKAKADAIAKAAGVGVGRVTNVVEGSTEQLQPMYDIAVRASARSTPIVAGTQDVQAHVTVTFAIG